MNKKEAFALYKKMKKIIETKTPFYLSYENLNGDLTGVWKYNSVEISVGFECWGRGKYVFYCVYRNSFGLGENFKFSDDVSVSIAKMQFINMLKHFDETLYLQQIDNKYCENILKELEMIELQIRNKILDKRKILSNFICNNPKRFSIYQDYCDSIDNLQKQYHQVYENCLDIQIYFTKKRLNNNPSEKEKKLIILLIEVDKIINMINELIVKLYDDKLKMYNEIKLKSNK